MFITHQTDSASKTIFPLLIIFIANLVFVYLKFVNDDSNFHEEHGLLESLQATLLAISGIIFLTYSVFQEKCSSLILLAFSLLCLTFFLREVNLEDFDLPAFLVYLGTAPLKHIILASLWVLITCYMALDFRNMKKLTGCFLLSRSGILVLICASLLFVSDIFERWFPETVNSEFFEELLEFNAYCFFIWSALISRSSLQGIINVSQDLLNTCPEKTDV